MPKAMRAPVSPNVAPLPVNDLLPDPTARVLEKEMMPSLIDFLQSRRRPVEWQKNTWKFTRVGPALPELSWVPQS